MWLNRVSNPGNLARVRCTTDCAMWHGNREDSYLSTETYIMTPSLETSHRDGYNEGSQFMFLFRYKNYF